jgi:iron(III) transport system ATP-binding protein
MLGLTASPRKNLAVRSSAEAVAVDGLSKSFDGEPVLRDLDLHVPAGAMVALLGASGCGKTTLMRSIAGLEKPDAGRIEIGHRLVSSSVSFVAPERRHVGMVFQEWALFPHLDVESNVAFGLSRQERKTGRIGEVLDLVGLGDLGARMPSTLSGGQQQRVALARALANRPSVILLDEPFSSLDAGLRVQVRAEVKRLLGSLGTTALFVTHDQEEALAMGEWVAVMCDGVIVQQARPGELYEAPATRTVAEFLGDANFVSGHASGRMAETPLGPIPLRTEVNGSVEVLLRPEELLVHSGDEASVESVEFFGHDAMYRVRSADGACTLVRVLAVPEFRVGDRVSLKYSGRPTVAFPAA